MIKVCFLSISFPLTNEVIRSLRAELIRLAEADTHLEFWFSGCHDRFVEKAVKFILEIRDVLSRSQIDIVAVTDPLYNEKWNITEYNEVKDGFPRGAVTRVVYAPRIEGKSEQYENRFVEHSRKVSRWYMEQCDILLAYHYDNIPHSVNTEIKRLKKREKPEIVSIYDPDFYQSIDTYIASMEDRDGLVLQRLRDGSTYKSLADELGITVNRVQQIASRATRKVMRFIRYGRT